jgi:hypothetical protein
MTVGELQFGPAIVIGLLMLMLVLQMTMKFLGALFQKMKRGTVPVCSAILRHGGRITQIVTSAGNVVLLDQFHPLLDTYHQSTYHH